MKKALSILLTVLLLFGTLSFALTAAAEGIPAVVDSGYCGAEGDGTNLTWTLTNDGTLTISGEGAMAEYDENSPYDYSPWYDRRSDIQTVKIEYGVKTIAGWAFLSCTEALHLEIADSVETIGDAAFADCQKLTAVTIPDSVKEIGSLAFHECRAVTRLVIGSSVEKIGSGAFLTTYGVTDVVFRTNRVKLDVCWPYLKYVFFTGTEEEWNQNPLLIFNFEPLPNYQIHFNADDHTPGEPVRENETAATCTASGSYDEVVYCIGCDYAFSRETKPLAAFGHSYGEWEVIKQATTDEEGLMERRCANDASHVETEIIPKLQPQTNAFRQFIERVQAFFRGIIDWFLRLFRF